MPVAMHGTIQHERAEGKWEKKNFRPTEEEEAHCTLHMQNEEWSLFLDCVKFLPPHYVCTVHRLNASLQRKMKYTQQITKISCVQGWQTRE